MTTSAWAPPLPDAAASAPSRTTDHDDTGPRLPTTPSGPAAGDATDWLAAIEPARDVRGLVPVAWLRLLWLVAQLGSVAAALGGHAAAAPLAALSLGLLMLWSALTAVNARRARPDTVYSRVTRPIVAAGCWLVPLGVTAVGVRAIVAANGGTMSDPAAAFGLGEVAMLLPFVLVASYVPYAVLGALTSWVGGARRRWNQWFVAPILVAILAGLMSAAMNVAVVQELRDGGLSFGGESAVFVAFLLAALPVIVMWWLGWAAMAETEVGARMTWERRTYPEGELDLSTELAQRLATAAYLASSRTD